MCRALYKRGFEPPISQGISKEKWRDIANIGIQSFIELPCVQSALNDHIEHV